MRKASLKLLALALLGTEALDFSIPEKLYDYLSDSEISKLEAELTRLGNEFCAESGIEAQARWGDFIVALREPLKVIA